MTRTPFTTTLSISIRHVCYAAASSFDDVVLDAPSNCHWSQHQSKGPNFHRGALSLPPTTSAITK